MKKAQKAKRKATAKIIWHSVGIMSYCLSSLTDLLLMESGVPVHQTSPLRESLSNKEFEALSEQVDRGRRVGENLRKIAKHIEKGTYATK